MIGDISISSKDTSKYHNNYEELIDVALKNEDRNNIWKIVISKYIKIKKLMNKKKDLTDEEINDLIDEWFEEIIDKFGI